MIDLRPPIAPPFNATRASHLVFTVADLARSKAFYTEVLGLVVSDEDESVLYLRGVEERCHHSLTLKRAEGRPGCERVGFRVYDEDDLDKAKRFFQDMGLPADWAETPYQGRTLHVRDRAGTPLEFCATMTTRERMHTKAHLHHGARAQRLDHYQVLVPDVYATARFYSSMGFRVSDYGRHVRTGKIAGIFMHRKDNPWDIVFMERPGPRFHHVGYIIESLNDVIHACDVAGNLGLADCVEHGPGRHGHMHSYFIYMRDPDGHRVELLLPAIQIIDIEDSPEEFAVGPGVNPNLWGFLPPPSWVNEASAFV